MHRSASHRTVHAWRYLLTAFCLLLGLSGCSRGESENFARARELERKLLMKGAEITYADPGYLAVARELEQVPPWSGDYGKAREKLGLIKDARRLKAGEVFALSYQPARLEGVELASLAPPQPDGPRARKAASEAAASRATTMSGAGAAETEPAAAPAVPAGDASGTSMPAGDVVAKKEVKKQGKHKPVIVYTTSWCGYCRKARAYLSQRNVPFVDKDVEEDPAAAQEMMSKAGYGGGVPVLDIDGTIIRGFDLRAIDAALARRTK